MDSNAKANNAEADRDCKGGSKGSVRNMTGMGYAVILRVLQCCLVGNTQQQQQQQQTINNNNNNNSEQIIMTERGDPQSYPSLSNSTG